MSATSASACLTVLEHEDVPLARHPGPGTLGWDEAELLSELTKSCRGLCERTFRSIRFGAYAGIITLGTRTIELLPKIDPHTTPEHCRGTLLRLLRAAPEVTGLVLPAVDQRLVEGPLLEAFFRAFLNEVLTVMRGGLLRDYAPRADDLSFVAGTLDMGRQATALAGRADVIACRYDEFDIDTPWNRAVKRALAITHRRSSHPTTQAQCCELLGRLDGVANVALTADDVGRLRFDRRSERYRRVIEWVRRIVAFEAPALRAGRGVAPGLLFDTAALFEAAVTQTLRRVAARVGEVRFEAQSTGHALVAHADAPHERIIGLRPDILLRRDGRPVAILDVKWKEPQRETRTGPVPSSPDAFQMLAYSHAIGCDRVALIYPKPRHLVAHRGCFTYVGTRTPRPTLSILYADLASDPISLVAPDGGPFDLASFLAGSSA